ncbi:MAG TPA: hypothetical protein VET23_00225 [Chitinophagaceae bacterium]|nr:hypothetical protein [Chitinophagaceae bacterium]
MKLASLLAEYLYVNKQLDLPGIGSFHLDPSAIIEEESSKPNKPVMVVEITFQNDASIKESPELVNFISSRSGKMKALAASDLESHLHLAKQFLNIGKPFLFEGIGSLVKLKSGQYEFSADDILNEKLKEYSGREILATSSIEDSFTGYQNVFIPKSGGGQWKRPVVMLMLIAGIAIAIWGGYKIYKHRASKENITIAPEQKPDKPIPVKDTALKTITQPFIQKDSVVSQKPSIEAGNYKFVVETANKKRGLFRYNALKDFGLNVQMETKDSITFKLFFLLPADAADTARMVDSLRILYTPVWSKAYVDNQIY